MSRHRYVVEYERSGDWWALRVPELPGVFTQVRRLDQATGMAKEAIATMLDVDATLVDVELGPTSVDPVSEVRALRATAERLARQASEATVAMARELVGRGLTVRDVGVMLNLSPQRVSQIVGPITSGHHGRRGTEASPAGREARRVTRRAKKEDAS